MIELVIVDHIADYLLLSKFITELLLCCLLPSGLTSFWKYPFTQYLLMTVLFYFAVYQGLIRTCSHPVALEEVGCGLNFIHLLNLMFY